MNIALILAGGKGLRLGADKPKQYLKINGLMIITRCLLRLLKNPNLNAIHIVAEKKWQYAINSELEMLQIDRTKMSGYSNPGITRQLSILNGLKDISSYADDTDVVMVHDSVRPLVSDKLISSALTTIKNFDGVMPALPMKDTVYFSNDGKKITSLLEREKIFAGQSPEFFRFKKYLDANVSLLPKKILEINGSTEPAILAGMNIAVVQGEEENFKITTQTDLERYRMMIEGDIEK